VGAMAGYAAGESSAEQSTTTVYTAPPPSGSYTQAYGSGGVVYAPAPQ
jgi:hypothetical protein